MKNVVFWSVFLIVFLHPLFAILQVYSFILTGDWLFHLSQDRGGALALSGFAWSGILFFSWFVKDDVI